MGILLIGHGQHGKDTAAGYFKELFGYKFESSSIAASRIFLFDILKEKYGYKDEMECFEDRINHRKEWHDLICEYNKDDKARLAKEILKDSHLYVGMRSDEECKECLKQGLFSWVIGIYDYRKPLEGTGSFDINIWERSDIIIPNSSTPEDLKERIRKLAHSLC